MDSSRYAQEKAARHEGERIFYTTCPANGCWDAACILKCHEKDGKLVAIEPDDTINAGNPREAVGYQNRCARAPWATPGRRSSTARPACSIP